MDMPVVNCSVSTDCQLPKSWDPIAAPETFKQVPLNPTSTEYRHVKESVMLTAGNTVNQILNVNTPVFVLLTLVASLLMRYDT